MVFPNKTKYIGISIGQNLLKNIGHQQKSNIVHPYLNASVPFCYQFFLKEKLLLQRRREKINTWSEILTHQSPNARKII